MAMKTDKQKAFTLIEVMMAMAVILILAGAILTGGKYLKVRAECQLTQSAIEIIDTAMEQYYEQTKKFPPMVSCPDCSGNNPDGTPQSLMAVLPANAVIVIKGSPDSTFWRGATAYYFLSRVPQSKAIMEGLAERMVSSKDSGGNGVQIGIQLVSGGPTDTYDWIRFVDAWGKSLNYEYQSGYSFPKITSAGPDKILGTDDDLKSP
jgi:prepilin-type N-terminal cleavage/methylation domain-containing protein